MTPKFETWSEMKDRHALERAEAIDALALSRITQAEAAIKLDITPRYMHNLIRRYDIFWPVIRQGKKSREMRQ